MLIIAAVTGAVLVGAAWVVGQITNVNNALQPVPVRKKSPRS